MKVEREAELAASADAVFDVLMDPSRLDEWVSIHEQLEEAPAELTEGATMTQRLKVAGQRFTVRWTVTEVERPDRAVWEGRGPAGTSARVVYRLTPGAEGGTCFNYVNEYELPGGAAGRLAGRAVSAAAGREVARSIERLRALVEG